MASDIVVRFVGQDSVTPAANKATNSINKVTSAASGVSGNLGGMSQALSGAVGGLGGFGGALVETAGALASTGAVTGTLGTAIAALGGPIGIAIVAAVGLAAAVFSVADAAARTANQVEALKRGIITLAGTKDVGEELYSTLIDLASRTPFERRDIMEMGQSLLATGVEAKKVPRYIEAIGNAVSTVGGGKDKLDAVTRALGKMSASGKITNEQMQILTENGIDGFAMLSRQLGYSKEDLMEMSSKGLIPAKGNLDLLVKSMEGKYGDAMSAQMGTATQAASNLSDAWEDLTVVYGTAWEPIVVGLYDSATVIVQGFTWIAKSIYDLGKGLIDFSIGAAIVTWTSAVEYAKIGVDELYTAFQSTIDAVVDFVATSTTVSNITLAWEGISGAAESAYSWISEGVSSVGSYITASDGLWWVLETWNKIWAAARGVAYEAQNPVPKSAQDEFNNPFAFNVSGAGMAGQAQMFEEVKALYGDIRNMSEEQLNGMLDMDLRTSKITIGFKDFTQWLYKYFKQLNQVIEPSKELSNILAQQGYSTNQLSQGYGVLAGEIMTANQVHGNYGTDLVDVIEKQKKNNDSTKAQNEALREQQRLLREAAQAQEEYKQNVSALDKVLNELRGSYMDIADAQRSVESAQKALQDAQDPNKILSLNLAIQQQAIDMRELNDSMAEMKARRDEIAKALRGMNEEQIRNNALTAAERRELNGLNTSLDNLRKRREAVRKALAGNQLDPQQRVEFMATEAALTAAINQETGQRQNLLDKQSAAIKKAQEDRIRLLEEDKKLQADLEKSQIRAQQAIIAMTESQKALAEAQDPKRLEAYRDAVTKAELNLAALRAEQARDKVTADELSATLGINSESFSALAESAGLTATPLDDVELRSGELSATLNGFDGTTALVGGLAGQMAKLGDNADDAVLGINKVGDALDGISGAGITTTLATNLNGVGDGITSIANANGLLTTDYLSAPLQSIKDLVGVLDTTRATAFQTWSNALNTAVDSMGDSDKVKRLINSMVALRNATSSSSTPLPYPGLSASNPGTGGLPDRVAQNITINLHYASPPSSKTPLKDVEDYLAAQGGRLRI